MKVLPVISTDQIARFFKDYRSPSKRASEMLCQLEREKLIEGRSREIGKTKVWRLSKKGREELEVKRYPTALNSMGINHLLAIGNIYLELNRTGELATFETELREEYKAGGKLRKYCPDAFFAFRKKGYLLELQLSPLSATKWGEKWSVVTSFFNGGYNNKASWQQYSNKPFTPNILVVTQQPKEIVTTGCKMPLIVMKDIRELVTVQQAAI